MQVALSEVVQVIPTPHPRPTCGNCIFYLPDEGKLSGNCVHRLINAGMISADDRTLPQLPGCSRWVKDEIGNR